MTVICKTVPLSSQGKHTIFGRVCGGIATVNRISMVETDPSDR